MASSAKPVKSGQIEIKPQYPNCCETHKGKLVTILVCASIALMVSGGVFDYFSIFKSVVCYSLMGVGGAVGLGATATALILYQVCTTSSAIQTQESKPKTKTKIKGQVRVDPEPYRPPSSNPIQPPGGVKKHPPPQLSKDPLLEDFLTTPTMPYPKWNALIKISDAPSLIAHLRSKQDCLPVISNQERLEDTLCARSMALHPNEAPLMEGPRFFNDDASIAFRLGKDLSTNHVSNAQKAFIKNHKLRPRHLDLNGCTHMILDSSILVHKSYTTLHFDGCPFVDVNAFAQELTSQKKLHTLSLGYESMLEPLTFDKLIANCPQLRHLTVAVDVKSEPLFRAPQKLESLKIRVPSLTPSILENILLCSPCLKHLTFWYTDVEWTHIGEIVILNKPMALKEMHFVNDTLHTRLQNSHSQLLEGVQIHMTHVYTESIFQSVVQTHDHNFWPASFLTLLKRYASHPDKLNALLKAVAQKGLTRDKLNQLADFGHILAEHLNWIDWSSLEPVLTPFDTKLQNYNCGLELLLRSALAHCQDKMNEKGSEDRYGSFFTWNSEVLNRILHTHQEILTQT